MIPTLYDKAGAVKIGDLTDTIECLIEEERNGLFELTMVYPATDSIVESIQQEAIVVADANDYLKNQKFRIYNIRKLMANRIEICARHISFDLAFDWVDNISIENQSCEYALNTIFKNSQFCKNFKGYSDIINAQDYKMNKATCLEAIGGERGSIIDTFGTGAEILRDNTEIHVLNRRGRDNDVVIEYRKNLTGLEIEEDTTDLVTRIMPYAVYTSEDNEEVEVRGDFVDSPLINNFAHPYVKYIDYSDKFEDDEKPTKEKLIELAKKEYINNKLDIPKCNFKIEFIPLSKCVGYEGLEDRINLCDTVTVKDTRYGLDTQAKVIKVTYNTLRDRYESMELGEPKTTLGDIIGGTGDGPIQGPPGPPGPAGEPGEDGSIGDFPETLPEVPNLTAKVYGFANIEISWTFENKVYYSYELYGSKTKGFVPNTFNLIFSGQASTYLYQAQPNEIWYFRACALNTHGQRTEFSEEIEVRTVKISDLSNYVESAAIGDALIGELNLGRGWVGQLRGNWIDAKQLSVTDGNGKRTLDIDSFGNVNLDVSSLRINSNSVATTNVLNTALSKYSTTLEMNTTIQQTAASITNTVSQTYYTKSEIENKKYTTSSELKQTADEFEFKFHNQNSPNLVLNGGFEKDEIYTRSSPFDLDSIYGGSDGYPVSIDGGKFLRLYTGGGESYFEKKCAIPVTPQKTYTVSYYYCSTTTAQGSNYLCINGNLIKLNIEYVGDRAWHRAVHKITLGSNVSGIDTIRLGVLATEECWVLFDNLQIELGDCVTDFKPHKTEFNTGITFIDSEGVGVKHSDGTYTKMTSSGFVRKIGSSDHLYHYLSYVGKVQKLDMSALKIQLPSEFKNKLFRVILSLEEVANPAGYMVQSIHLVVDNYDYVNATFEILYGTMSQFHDGTNGMMQPTTISYTVIA